MNAKEPVTIKQRIAYWNPFSRTRNFLDAVYDHAARFFAPLEH